ncbi:hypothetical protein Bcep18194_A3998 [Burkholderia lata]|uniref:Uncharacterized protein n=1 Tax=Burkholderia lata (strain ATCC 17760 / DSM 23089 / LMG 22485 / NCIMB 9086 / R18194 / 383) TaxID=482957 RepID=Q39IX1_BURL3|nr:hypothetical protein Bcep18194_A3998 [Burkholderia lata]
MTQNYRLEPCGSLPREERRNGAGGGEGQIKMLTNRGGDEGRQAERCRRPSTEAADRSGGRAGTGQALAGRGQNGARSPQKVRDVLREGVEVRCGLNKCDETTPVPPMCRVLGVHVSGHHVWRKRKSPERAWQEPRPGSGGAHGPPANPGKFQAGAPAATSGGEGRANRLAPGQETAQKIGIALQAEAPDQGHDEFEARRACRVESAEPRCLGDGAQSSLVW